MAKKYEIKEDHSCLAAEPVMTYNVNRAKPLRVTSYRNQTNGFVKEMELSAAEVVFEKTWSEEDIEAYELETMPWLTA